MPASMRWTWAEELEKWLPDLRPGDVKVIKNRQDTDGLDGAKFCLCTYDLFVRSPVLRTVVHNHKFGMCIVDESHYCKNRDAKRTTCVESMARKVKRCVLLSGTPAVNRPVELFAQVAMIDANLLGSFSAFAVRHCDARRGRFGWEYKGAVNLPVYN